MRARLSLRLLLVASCLTGLLAGANFVRMFIETRAWRETGPLAWAAFSRHADLGSGLFIYPLLAIGGAVLTWAAAVLVRLQPATRPAILLLTIASVLVLAGLALTFFAAPQMLSLRHLGDDSVAIQRAFDAFDFWGNLRGVDQMLAFVATLWGLGRLVSLN